MVSAWIYELQERFKMIVFYNFSSILTVFEKNEHFGEKKKAGGPRGKAPGLPKGVCRF